MKPQKLCLNCNKLSTPGHLLCCKLTGEIKLPLSKACEHWAPSPDVAHLFKQATIREERGPRLDYGTDTLEYQEEQEDKHNE